MKKTALILLVLSMLIGCATGPVKQEEFTIFYPPLPQRPRLQFLLSVATEHDIGGAKATWDEWLSDKDPEAKYLVRPWDIDSSKGKIYISDKTLRKVVVIDLVNKTFGHLDADRYGGLPDPVGIWITEDDTKYVTDMTRKQVVAFDSNNEYLRAYGGEHLFSKPLDVAVHENKIYVCDFQKNQVFVLDKTTGKRIRTMGDLGRDKGQFYRPSHLIIDHLGNLYVTDSLNFRIQKFDPSGNFIKSFGRHGDTPGSFARPKGLDVDREGNLYVADAAFQNVQVFEDGTGSLLLFFGGGGTNAGQMVLPSGVHIDYKNVEHFNKFADKDFSLRYVLYVGNSYGNNKLNVYGFGEWVGEPLPGEE
jgi:DNA-binding beta-propeller fold protein YncE